MRGGLHSSSSEEGEEEEDEEEEGEGGSTWEQLFLLARLPCDLEALPGPVRCGCAGAVAVTTGDTDSH